MRHEPVEGNFKVRRRSVADWGFEWQDPGDVLRLRIKSIGPDRSASEMNKSRKEAVRELLQG
jgi:hypothetical protein